MEYSKNSSFFSKYRFLLLLISQVFLVCATAFIKHEWMADLWAAICLTLITVSGIYSFYKTKTQLFVGGILGVLVIISSFLQIESDLKSVEQLQFSIAMVFTLWLFFNVLREIMSHKTISVNSILGAVNGFYLLGLLTGIAAYLVRISVEGAYRIGEGLADDFYTFLYYGYITITTVGYGDITPLIPESQSVMIVFSVAGPLYLAVVISSFVGSFIAGAKMNGQKE